MATSAAYPGCGRATWFERTPMVSPCPGDLCTCLAADASADRLAPRNNSTTYHYRGCRREMVSNPSRSNVDTLDRNCFNARCAGDNGSGYRLAFVHEGDKQRRSFTACQARGEYIASQ